MNAPLVNMQATKLQELRKHWPVLFAASFGGGVGAAGLWTYNAGLFLGDLNAAFGLTKAQFGFGYFLLAMCMAITIPIVGWAIDRYGVRWPSVVGAAGMTASFVGLGLFVNSSMTYLAMMLLIGVLASPSTSVAFTRAVNGCFDHGRGFALGVAQAGTGVSAAIVPVITAHVIQQHGWRAGYLTLAGIAALGILTAFLLRGDGQRREKMVASSAEFTQARKTPLFWLLFTAFTGMALAFIGLIVHYVPILRSHGASLEEAGGFASVIGVSVIVFRLTIGWLADHFHAPWLAVAACAVGAAGSAALLSDSPALWLFGAIAIGCAVGAEIDLVGYLTSRYFELGIYGRAYGWLYAGIVCASGAGPAWVGWVADYAGGYQLALMIIPVASLGVMALFMLLPRYKGLAAS